MEYDPKKAALLNMFGGAGDNPDAMNRMGSLTKEQADDLRWQQRTAQLDAQAAQQQSAAKAAREADLAAGRARGQEMFSEGSLGRVRSERSQDINDVMARRRANLEGFTAEEQNAMRDTNLKAIQQAAQGQMRSLRRDQARSGVRGATASAQMAAAQKANQGVIADQERELFLKQMDARRQALGQFEQSATGAEAQDLARQQFNIAQQNKEKQAQLATEFGYAQLGQADRASQAQLAAGTKAAEAQRDAAKKAGQK